MKILQINCVFNEGSTGKIVYDLHTQLRCNGHESIICYGRGKRVNQKNVYKIASNSYAKVQKVRSMITGVMYGGCRRSTLQLEKLISVEKPDVCHIHCINGNFVNIYKLVTWLQEHNIKTLLTLHAEFMHTGNCSYAVECEKWKYGCGDCPHVRERTKSVFLDNTHISWEYMRSAFEGFNTDLRVVSVSPWLMNRAQQSPILANKQHCVILNGINTEIFCWKKNEKNILPEDIRDKKILLHVTSFFTDEKEHIKGGYYLIELAKQLMKYKDIVIVVAGAYEPTVSVPPNICLLGKVTDQNQLAQLYSMSQLTAIVSKRETFSMIVAESMCCGTPVVGFCAGAPEQIAIPEYSRFVEFGDVDNLAKCVKYMLDINQNKEKLSQIAIEKYSKNRMFADYMKIYEGLL